MLKKTCALAVLATLLLAAGAFATELDRDFLPTRL